MKHILKSSFPLLLVISAVFTACSGNDSNDDILSDIEQDKGLNINIEISPTSLSMVQGDSTALMVKVHSSDTNDFRVTWSSSNTAIATVNEEGKVKANAVGEAIITVASVVDKTKSASCTINVKKPAETKTFNVKGISFTMKAVEPGSFTVLSPTVHGVTISKHYYIGETEVTQGLWKAVTGYSPRPSFKGETWETWYGVGYDYPAYYIDYDDVQSFLKALNKLTGVQFRMPTEAEWEFAAQGGNKTKYYIYSGSDNIDDVAWCKENSGSTSHPVKTKQPNELGLYDMSGNVWEWCSDWYDEYPSFDVTDPTGPVSGSKRVIRGGGWSNYATNCFTDLRHKANRYDTFTNLGVRLACSEVFE